MLLPDHEIRRLVKEHNLLDPFMEGDKTGVASAGLTHAGYDLRLGNKVLVYKNTHQEIVDPARFQDGKYVANLFDTVELVDGGTILVPPHSYILAYSLEHISMPRLYKGRCVGKSTWARCGLICNTTPIEPGWAGHLTLEIANVGPNPVRIYQGRGIAQLEIEVLSSEPGKCYDEAGGKYHNQQAEPVTPRVK